jgi:hypothetical protein
MGRYATKFATVTQDDREWLRGQWKNGETHTTRCRAHAIILSSQHLSTVEISLILAVTYETVSSWLDRWEVSFGAQIVPAIGASNGTS